MALGALLDAGLPFEDLQRALGSLALDAAHVQAHRVLRAGVSATKFSVQAMEHGAHEHRHDHHGAHDHSHHHEAHGDGAHRNLEEIFHLIDHSSLTPPGRERARAMFRRLGEAEAAIHHTPIDRVHLHEVGAIDSIIDIVGIVHAMDWANADRVVCSPLNVGGGMVQSAHGLFPVPAPATVRLLGDAPIYGGRVQKELVTPTGALIATTFASAFGPMPPMSIERVGYGAGDRDDAETPNVVRVLIGREVDAPLPGDRVTVIECEIDDMNPQLFGVVMDRLFAAGALEVFYTPVQMKKNRPGTILEVLCKPVDADNLRGLLLRHTSTLGVRETTVKRHSLPREIREVQTPFGVVRVKIATLPDGSRKAAPEHDDCVTRADEYKVTVNDVWLAAARAFDDSRSV